MNKRPPPAARAAGAPPLPAGRPPAAADAAQQASISAAWAAYYASMGAGGTPAAGGATQQPGANAAQYQNYGYGAGAAPAIQNAMQGATAAYVPQQHQPANVRPQAFPAQPFVAPQPAYNPQQAAYMPQAYQPQQAPVMQQGYVQPQAQHHQQPQVGAYGHGHGHGQATPMQAPYQPQQPLNGYQAPQGQGGAWQQPNAYGAAPMQSRPPGPGPGPNSNGNGAFGGPRPMRPNNPATPGPPAGNFGGGQYSPANNFAPQQGPGPGPGQGQGMRPPMRPPQGAGPGPLGQGFPPAKRPRTDGPPLPGPGPGQGPGPGPGPGPMPRNPSMASNRGGGPPGVGGRGGYHGDHDRRDYPPPSASDFGGSQHSGHGGSVRGGAPRGRGAPPLRGAPAGRGGRGGFVPGGGGGYNDPSRIPPGSANRGRGGMADRGSYRGGRGGPPSQTGSSSGKPFPANGPRGESNTPRGARDSRDSRPATRGGTPSKPQRGSSVTSTKPRAASRDREQDRVKDEERARKMKEEARRRTFTDFRIVGLEIRSLDWQWGTVRSVESADEDEDEVNERADDGRDDVSSDEDEDEEDGVPEHKRQNGSSTPAKSTDLVKVEQQDVKKAEEESGPGGETQLEETSNGVASSEEKGNPTDPSKRGEKRKAKMSSPDADDDVLVASKKRPHIDEAKAEDPKPPASDKNRFRIYFDSPVAPFVAPPRAVKRKADVSDDKPRDAPKPNALQVESCTEDELAEQEASEAAAEQPVVKVEESTDAPTETAEGVHNASHEPQQPGENPGYEDVEGEEEIDEQLDDAVEVDIGENSNMFAQALAGATGSADEHTAAISTGEALEEQSAPFDEPTGELNADISMTGSHAEGTDVVAATENPEASVEAETTTDAPDEGGLATAPEDSVETAPGEPEETKAEPEAQPETAALAPAVDLTPGQIAQAAAEEAERVAKALKESAANTSAAYASKASKAASSDQKGKKVQDFREEGFRRSPSLPPTDSATPLPAPGRLSILYDNGQRRMCLDAAVINKIRICRSKGSITVTLRLPDAKATANKIKQIAEQTEKMEVGAKESPSEVSTEIAAANSSKPVTPAQEEPPSWGLAKGLLLETLDEKRGLFSQVTREALLDLWNDTAAAVQSCSPPLHRLIGQDEGAHVVDLVAYLDRDRPLTEPRWVKTGHIDEWIQSITGNASVLQARKSDPALTAWDNKVEIVDPDAPPTIDSVLETWVDRTKDKNQLKQRKRFVQTQFGNMSNVVQILLRLIRGESQKAVVPRAQLSSLHGPLATAIKPSAPFADQQTHATLAVLAVVNMAREYAEKSGEKMDFLDARMAEIVKSLPNNLIYISVDRLYADWVNKTVHKKGRR